MAFRWNVGRRALRHNACIFGWWCREAVVNSPCCSGPSFWATGTCPIAELRMNAPQVERRTPGQVSGGQVSSHELVWGHCQLVRYETIRLWVNRFGKHFAECVKRDRPSAADKWHLDEVVRPVNGEKQWLWRAVDANGDVLDILVQNHRNAKAAKRFLKRLVDRFGEPRFIITDKLRSYIKPIKTLAPDADHGAHKGLNNLAEGSHRPTRKREKLMGRFKSPEQAQRFLAAHDQINVIFRPNR